MNAHILRDHVGGSDGLQRVARKNIGIADAVSGGMNGFITERNFAEAEVEFPGIEVFYLGLRSKPSTFLELLRLCSVDPALDVDGAGSSPSDSLSRRLSAPAPVR